MDSSVGSAETDEIGAWKEVHRHLTLAIALTKDAISAEKFKLRYLLEEISLNVGTDGKLNSNSKWGTSKKQRKKPLDSSIQKKEKVAKKVVSKNSKSKKVKEQSSSTSPPKKRLKLSLRSPCKKVAGQEGERDKSNQEMADEVDQSVYDGTSPETRRALYSPRETEHNTDYAFAAENPPETSFQASLEATAAAIAVASQVASQAVASFPPEPVGQSMSPNSRPFEDDPSESMFERIGDDDEEEEYGF